MRASHRERAQQVTRRRSQSEQRAQREAVRREADEADRAAATDRERRAAQAVKEREQRDAKVRARAKDVTDRLALAHRAAEDAQTDFELGIQALAAGATTFEAVQALQSERDARRRDLEIWSMCAGDLRGDAALAGRR